MLSKWRHYVWCISLLLCLATSALWVRSYWRKDVVDRLVSFHPAWFHEPGDEQVTTLEAASVDGGVSIEWWGYPAEYIGPEQISSVRWRQNSEPIAGPVDTEDAFRAEGMPHGIYAGPYGLAYGAAYGWRYHQIVPHWSLAILFFLAPAWLTLMKTRKWERRRRGRCGGCGYDLRASPERCPECGRIVAKRAGATK